MWKQRGGFSLDVLFYSLDVGRPEERGTARNKANEEVEEEVDYIGLAA
jgi:hypothetical protein